MSQLALTNKIYSWFLGTGPSSCFLFFCTNCPKHLYLFLCRILCCPLVKPTTVKTPSIHTVFSPFFQWNPPFACTEVYGHQYAMSSNCSGLGSCMIIQGCWGLRGGGEPYRSWCLLYGLLSPALSDLVIPVLAQSYEYRKFLRHISILEEMLSLLLLFCAQGNSHGWEVTITVCRD